MPAGRDAQRNAQAVRSQLGVSSVANTLGYYNPAFYANEALIFLKKSLGLANRVHRGFDAERRTFNRGDVINIRRPAIFAAANAPATAVDLNTESVQMTLSSWKEVKFKLTDKELAYTGQRIIEEHIAPAAYALADQVDQDVAALAITVPHAYVEPSAGTALTLAGITKARQKLFDLKVPMQDPTMLHFMLSGQAEADALALAAFTQWQGAGATGEDAQVRGMLGQRFGMNFFANQNTTTAVYADITDKAGAINNGAGYAKGTTSIAVDALDASGSYKKGTIIKMTSGADNGSEYTIAADATMSTGAATITISPGLRNAVADNDTFAVQTEHDNTTNVLNLAFHRDWAAVAFARLPDYGVDLGNDLGVKMMSIQDPVTGLAVRARIYAVGNSSEVHVALDALYGVKELNADLAARYEFKVA